MGSELDPTVLFSLRSDWRGCRQPLDAVINASASAAEAGAGAAEVVEAGAAGADGARRGGGDGGGDGQESQPSYVRQDPEARPLRSAARVSLYASGRPLRLLRVRLRQKPQEV